MLNTRRFFQRAGIDTGQYRFEPIPQLTLLEQGGGLQAQRRALIGRCCSGRVQVLLRGGEKITLIDIRLNLGVDTLVGWCGTLHGRTPATGKSQQHKRQKHV